MLRYNFHNDEFAHHKSKETKESEVEQQIARLHRGHQPQHNQQEIAQMAILMSDVNCKCCQVLACKFQFIS